MQRGILFFLRALNMKIRNDFQNKWALITGGSSGIGFALAKQILSRGGNVALLARHEGKLQSAAQQLNNFKLNPNQVVFTIMADVTELKELEVKLLAFVQDHGTPDFLFNSAGVAHPGTFEETDESIFRWMMDVNYFGTVNVLKVMVPLMKHRHSGVIVNLSSIAGFIGVYGYTAYGASKFAISGFTDALRSELKPQGIQVSIVFPPDTDTPQLEYESQFKPAVTKQIAGSANLMTADAVASEILKGVNKKQYIILPGSEGKLMYFAHHLIGRLIYPVLDLMVKSALKKNPQNGG